MADIEPDAAIASRFCLRRWTDVLIMIGVDMTALKIATGRRNPSFLRNFNNPDKDYVVCSFNLYESELKRLRKMCPPDVDIDQFVTKAVVSYLRRADGHWAPSQKFSGQRTRVFARLPRELHSKAMDTWSAEPIAEAVAWYISEQAA